MAFSVAAVLSATGLYVAVPKFAEMPVLFAVVAMVLFVVEVGVFESGLKWFRNRSLDRSKLESHSDPRVDAEVANLESHTQRGPHQTFPSLAVEGFREIVDQIADLRRVGEQTQQSVQALTPILEELLTVGRFGERRREDLEQVVALRAEVADLRRSIDELRRPNYEITILRKEISDIGRSIEQLRVRIESISRGPELRQIARYGSSLREPATAFADADIVIYDVKIPEAAAKTLDLLNKPFPEIPVYFVYSSLGSSQEKHQGKAVLVEWERYREIFSRIFAEHSAERSTPTRLIVPDEQVRTILARLLRQSFRR